MNKIEITITDDFNGVKQTSIRETKELGVSLSFALEAIEDCLRGLGFTIDGHLTVNKE